jgi:hypothetical protein
MMNPVFEQIGDSAFETMSRLANMSRAAAMPATR